MVLLARLTIDGFASLWCAWAAISSAAFAIHLRFQAPGEITGWTNGPARATVSR